MGVDLAGSGRGTMAQGLADIVHGDPFGAGNAGKAVAEAVKGQRRKMVLRDETRKEFRSVVRTHRSSVLICKDAAAVPIGIFQKSTAILIQSVSGLRCFLFARLYLFHGHSGF